MALLIDNEVSSTLLDMTDCLRVLEEAFVEEGRGEAAGRNKSSIHVPTTRPGEWYRYASMEGASRALKVAATRIKSDVVSWLEGPGGVREVKWTGRPGKFGGLILLFSTETGELLAILNDGWLQHMRVGATYAISTHHQARADARVVGLLGSGGMARTYIEALVRLRPIQKVRVFSPNQEHARAYAEEMSEKLQLTVQPVGMPEAAMAGADILASMTDTMDPIILPEMLRPGVHVTTVTSYELHPKAYPLLHRMATYRDDISEHHYTTPANHRPMRQGGSSDRSAKLEAVIPRDRFHRLTDIMLGRATGRGNPDEITYFLAQGTGVQFAAVASHTYRCAVARGLGRELPAEWFLQDIRT